ncbi:hypothetical protein [Solimonas flava]|uniref:hypothetical protein n=1 Tax=Solimonas flava TaxID=415849 RepID=UPI00048993D9|nr:hypothetical protein [Solimonas flava]
MSLSTVDLALAAAARRNQLLRPALIRIDQGCSVRAAAEWLHTCTPDAPQAATLERWLRAVQKLGLNGLLSQHRGAKRKDGLASDSAERMGRHFYQQSRIDEARRARLEYQLKRQAAHLQSLGLQPLDLQSPGQ